MRLRNVDLKDEFFSNHVLVNFLPKEPGEKGPILRRVELLSGAFYTDVHLVSLDSCVRFDEFFCRRKDIKSISW